MTNVIFCYNLCLNWRKDGINETNAKLFNIHIRALYAVMLWCLFLTLAPHSIIDSGMFLEDYNPLLIVVLIKIVLDTVFFFFKSLPVGPKGMEKQNTKNYHL